MTTHHTHPEIVKRLKRAHGHLAKIIEMVETETPCLEVAQQMQAVVNALINAKRVYVQDHIEHCFNETSAQDAKKLKEQIAEFKEITKYL